MLWVISTFHRTDISANFEENSFVEMKLFRANGIISISYCFQSDCPLEKFGKVWVSFHILIAFFFCYVSCYLMFMNCIYLMFMSLMLIFIISRFPKFTKLNGHLMFHGKILIISLSIVTFFTCNSTFVYVLEK